MYDAGANVSVNSDDPPMFGTTLNREYAIAADLLDLDEPGIAALAGNAVRASFMSEPDKAALLAEIDAYVPAASERHVRSKRAIPGHPSRWVLSRDGMGVR